MTRPKSDFQQFTKLLPGLLCLSVLLTGCAEMNLSLPSTFTTKSKEIGEEDFDLDARLSDEPPYIGEYITVSGLNMVVLEGVGLVTGLPGTGEDPPPSQYRSRLLTELRRLDVQNPNQLISSPSTALVVVRGYLPPLINVGDKFDLEVRVPPGSQVASLNGGKLMECRLTERAIIPGVGMKEGRERAIAKGPILVSVGIDKASSSKARLTRGRVVGGGTSMQKRDMQLVLRNDYRSVRNASRIAAKIGKRFFAYDNYGQRKPLAEAKTDQRVVLSLMPRYKDNFNRYIDVINNVAFRESDVEERIRLERLSREILIPQKSERAAIQLEGIGDIAIDALRGGLKSPHLECRFHAATALCYLGNADGLEVLYEVIRDEPAFRVYALAAMTALDDLDASIHLRKLMSESSLETKYGAFRALSEIDPRDPFLNAENLNNQLTLYSINVGGSPMIHLTHIRKSEVVLFGAYQKFQMPLALHAGKTIRIRGQAGGDTVVISRYEIGQPDQRVEVSNEISDVVQAVVDLGGTYPDVAQMLMEAELQKSLPGKIGIDQLPEGGRYYERAVAATDDNDFSTATIAKKTRIGRSGSAPNLYYTGEAPKRTAKVSHPGFVDGKNDQDSKSSMAPKQDEEEESSTWRKFQSALTNAAPTRFLYDNPDDEFEDDSPSPESSEQAPVSSR